MIIDGHAHAAREYSTIEGLSNALSINRVDKVVLCPSLKNKTDLSDPPKIFQQKKEIEPGKQYSSNKLIRFTFRFLKENGDGNKFVHSLVKKLPDKILQFYWVDMRNIQIADTLRASFNEMNYKGIKIHQAWTPFKIKGEQFRTVLDFADMHNLPIFIHPYSKKDTKELIDITLKYNNINFIIAHLFGLNAFENHKLDNVFHDISPHYLTTIALTNAINIYGADKIIFGSDMPFGKLDKILQKIGRLKIDAEKKDKILGENIARILNL